jgi:hypothetical protein
MYIYSIQTGILVVFTEYMRIFPAYAQQFHMVVQQENARHVPFVELSRDVPL